LGFPEGDVPAICADAFDFNKKPRTADQFHLVTSVADAYNPDCGNMAVKTLHEMLPALSARNMLACDYFTFDAATALGAPALHHTRDVFHEYAPDRFVLESKLSYWEAVAKFADYFNSYMGIYKADLDRRWGRGRSPLIDGEIVGDIAARIKEFAGRGAADRRARIGRISKEVLIPFDARYARVGEYLLERADRLVEEASGEYETHARLLPAWPEMIERARKLPLYDFADELEG
jgi:hypothetical protein